VASAEHGLQSALQATQLAKADALVRAVIAANR
jgi:hypothetical protein